MCPASLIDQSSGIFTTATLSTPVRRDTCAVVDNVRAALGIGESVYNERPVPLALFGNYNDLGGVKLGMEISQAENCAVCRFHRYAGRDHPQPDKSVQSPARPSLALPVL